VRKSTPAITSLDANVWRLQCQEQSRTSDSFKAGSNQSRCPRNFSPYSLRNTQGESGLSSSC